MGRLLGLEADVRTRRGTLIFSIQAVPYAIEGKGSTATARIADRDVVLNMHPVMPGVWAVTCDGRWLKDEFKGAREEPDESRALTAQGDLRAPMPGVVTRMLVQPGQMVGEGGPYVGCK